jgi:SAM-dependent methyltransferase
LTIRHLPPVTIEGQPSGAGTPDHPMRVATLRAAGINKDGWTDDLRHDVERYFDDLAGEWHTRTAPEHTAVFVDALTRGLNELQAEGGLALEVGSGIGTYSALLAERFTTVLAIDLSLAMLRLAPAMPAHRVRADGAVLPVRDASAAAVVLVNAFLFPAEVDRVLRKDGLLVWVNSTGEQTPIYLSPDQVAARLPGSWQGIASRAGEGIWCVLQRE